MDERERESSLTPRVRVHILRVWQYVSVHIRILPKQGHTQSSAKVKLTLERVPESSGTRLTWQREKTRRKEKVEEMRKRA